MIDTLRQRIGEDEKYSLFAGGIAFLVTGLGTVAQNIPFAVGAGLFTGLGVYAYLKLVEE